MSDNIKKVCEKYDNFIGFSFLDDKDNLENISKDIKDTVDKKLPLASYLVEIYNKKLVSIDITGILEKFNIKANEPIHKAIIYGKTSLYYSSHPNQGETLGNIINEIYVKIKTEK